MHAWVCEHELACQTCAACTYVQWLRADKTRQRERQLQVANKTEDVPCWKQLGRSTINHASHQAAPTTLEINSRDAGMLAMLGMLGMLGLVALAAHFIH